MDDLDETLFDQMLSLGLLPNIQNEINNKSIRFNNAFVTDSACCPSRASILTGKYPHNHLVKSVLNTTSIQRAVPAKGAWPAFQDVENNTLSKWLKADAQYTNGIIGKYFHNFDNASMRPNEKEHIFNNGWDFFKIIPTPPYNYNAGEYQTVQVEKDQGTEGPWVVYPNFTELNFIFKQSEYFINKHSNATNPFFLMITPLSPHVTSALRPIGNTHPAWSIRTESTQCGIGGFNAEEFPNKKCPNNSLRNGNDYTPSDQRYYPDSMKSTAFGNFEPGAPWNNNWQQLTKNSNDRNFQGLVRLHLDRMESMISVDLMVSKVINSLRVNNELENTIIIFTSDNGYVMGEHNLGNKISIYEESIRIPLFIRYDKAIKNPGTGNDHIALNIDIAPTILSLVGLNWQDSKYNVDGRPLNFAQAGSEWRNSFIVENWKFRGTTYWEFPDFVSVRNNIREKFAEYFNDIDANNPAIYGQYFEINKDQYETTNTYSTIKNNVIRYTKLVCLANLLKKCSGNSCRIYDKEYKIECTDSIAVADYDNNLVKDRNDFIILAKTVMNNNPNIPNPNAKTDLNTDNKRTLLDVIYLLTE